MADIPPPELIGLVAVLDALGVKNRDIQQSRVFLRQRDAIIEVIEGEAANHEGTIEVQTFGDTFVITLDAVPDVDGTAKPPTPYDLWGLVETFNVVMLEGLQQGLLIRGAVAYGEFIRDENTILGPAVSAAATWYDKADWAGIVIAPGTSLWTDFMDHDSQEKGQKPSPLVKYDVPMTKGGKLRMQAVPWPRQYVEKLSDKTELWRARESFMEDLRKHEVAGGETKFANTIAYWEHVVGWKGS